MTIRAWMFLVAVIAFLLGIGVEERLMQRRARQEARMAIRRDQYLFFAKMHADTESFWRRSEALRAALETSLLDRIATLSSMSRSEPERDPGNTELQEVKQRLDLVRSLQQRCSDGRFCGSVEEQVSQCGERSFGARG